MSKFNKNSTQKGASLIEMAFFIVVGTMILTAGAPILHYYQVNKESQTTDNNLLQAQNALDAYYQTHQRFPCPAPRNVALDTPTYGLADTTNPCTSAATGVATNFGDGTVRAVNAVSQAPIRIGALPVRTLGLPDSGDMDGYGHRLLFAMTEKYATTSAPTNLNMGAITVNDSKQHSSIASSGGGVYIVIAPGSDRRGAYNINGKLLQPCDTNPNDLASKNCSDSGSFISSTLTSPSGTGAFTSKTLYRAGVTPIGGGAPPITIVGSNTVAGALGTLTFDGKSIAGTVIQGTITASGLTYTLTGTTLTVTKGADTLTVNNFVNGDFGLTVNPPPTTSSAASISCPSSISCASSISSSSRLHGADDDGVPGPDVGSERVLRGQRLSAGADRSRCGPDIHSQCHFHTEEYELCGLV